MKTKTHNIQKMISTLMMVIGVLLLIYMIFAESEPGAIPLLLIVVGAGWRISLQSWFGNNESTES